MDNEQRDSLEDIKARIRELQSQADAIRAAERAEFIAKTREGMELYGVNPQDLAKGRRIVGKAKPKYRDIDDPNRTWTGRGRVPHWVRQWEDEGGSRDDLLIG